jgi:hypothetical protein
VDESQKNTHELSKLRLEKDIAERDCQRQKTLLASKAEQYEILKATLDRLHAGTPLKEELDFVKNNLLELTSMNSSLKQEANELTKVKDNKHYNNTNFFSVG